MTVNVVQNYPDPALHDLETPLLIASLERNRSMVANYRALAQSPENPWAAKARDDLAAWGRRIENEIARRRGQ